MASPEPESRSAHSDPQTGWRPWTLAGRADPDFDDADRNGTHALLTDPRLARFYRSRFRRYDDADYDEMIRALGYVWDCPHDDIANVTGYRCAGCDRTRAEAQRRGPSR